MEPRRFFFPRGNALNVTAQGAGMRRSIQKLMWRLRWNPDRAGTLWLLAAALAIIAVFAAVMIAYPFAQQQNAGAGFGPEWECTPQASGGPTCIKKIGR